MASWCRDIESPVIFDVGANNGFVATQVAQLLRERSPEIYAFEPVPSTFAQMVLSIERLELGEFVTPVCCALSDSIGMCMIAYNPRESLFAQVRSDDQNPRAGNRLSAAPTMTIDKVVSALGKKPSLLKIDVEGFEPNVFRGAAGLLAEDNPPAVCFEWNPITLGELKSEVRYMSEALRRHKIFYVDDFQGQRKTLGTPIDDLRQVDWVCNVFAIPDIESSVSKWTSAVAELQDEPLFAGRN
jgi:FkbM family methyltransferase